MKKLAKRMRLTCWWLACLLPGHPVAAQSGQNAPEPFEGIMTYVISRYASDGDASRHAVKLLVTGNRILVGGLDETDLFRRNATGQRTCGCRP